MDAPCYNGSDDRCDEPEPGTCLVCGAGPSEDCAIGCGCEGCAAGMEPPDADGEAFRGDEAAAYQREQQYEVQKLK